jgi:hypothetical protein
MIARLSLFLAFVAAASAFSFSSSGARSRNALSMSGEKSKALPFLKRPAKVIPIFF